MLAGCDTCITCLNSLHLRCDDAPSKVTEALRDHGIPHDLRGDTIRFDPWHERETLRIHARVMMSGDGEILSRFDSREEAVPFLEFLAEKNIEQRSPPCDPTAVVWRPRDEAAGPDVTEVMHDRHATACVRCLAFAMAYHDMKTRSTR
jgi:hypothetical protein